jgi:hypothetical protein
MFAPAFHGPELLGRIATANTAAKPHVATSAVIMRTRSRARWPEASRQSRNATDSFDATAVKMNKMSPA